MIKLNIGCGHDYKEGFINTDTHSRFKHDLIYILPDRLPYENESVDYILVSHVLEDLLFDYLPAMRELHRVLKKNSILEIRVPYGLAPSNPYHKRWFDENSFLVFINGTGDYDDELPIFSKIRKISITRRAKFIRKILGMEALTGKLPFPITIIDKLIGTKTEIIIELIK